MLDDSTLRESRGEISVEWEIKNFFSLSKGNTYVDSPIFLLSDAHWFLRIYPNPCDGWVSLYLRKKYSLSENHIVQYQLYVKNCDGSLYKSFGSKREFNGNTGNGCDKIFNSSELRVSRDGVCPNDSFTVVCTARICSNLLNARISDASSQTLVLDRRSETLVQNLKDLLASERHVDIKIKVKDQEFRAHRLILAARSPVINSMFDHNMVEKDSGVINMDDCDPDIIPDFLHFLYTGKMDQATSENVPKLYKLSVKYDVKELKEECGRCMGRDISSTSFCDVVIIASVYNDTELLKDATEFFIKNWTTLLPLPKWQSFLAEHHMLVNELFIELGNSMK